MTFEGVLRRIVGNPGGAQDFVIVTPSGELTLSQGHPGEEPHPAHGLEPGELVTIELRAREEKSPKKAK